MVILTHKSNCFFKFNHFQIPGKLIRIFQNRIFYFKCRLHHDRVECEYNKNLDNAIAKMKHLLLN